MAAPELPQSCCWLGRGTHGCTELLPVLSPLPVRAPGAGGCSAPAASVRGSVLLANAVPCRNGHPQIQRRDGVSPCAPRGRLPSWNFVDGMEKGKQREDKNVLHEAGNRKLPTLNGSGNGNGKHPKQTPSIREGPPEADKPKRCPSYGGGDRAAAAAREAAALPAGRGAAPRHRGSLCSARPGAAHGGPCGPVTRLGLLVPLPTCRPRRLGRGWCGAREPGPLRHLEHSLQARERAKPAGAGNQRRRPRCWRRRAVKP